MALVAYDYSDSGSENEEEDNSSCVIINKKQEPENGIEINESNEPVNTESSTSTLFASLPETKPSGPIVEDQIEDFIPKSAPISKEKQKVKITIPSLRDFDDVTEDENTPRKRTKLSSKGSGLISLLPPVQGSPLTAKSFVPKSVVKNSNPKPKSNSSLVPNSVRLNAEAKKKAVLAKALKKDGSDLESDDEIDLPDTFDEDMWKKVCGRPKKLPVIKEPEIVPQPVISESVNIAPEPEKPYDGLDNVAFKELVGKNRRPIGNIKLIDLNEEEIIPEKDIWMRKSLTDPEMEPKALVDNPVDPTRKKKHHITYLAEQAKANEQDFKNQWSASKNTRLMTRAKYGF